MIQLCDYNPFMPDLRSKYKIKVAYCGDETARRDETRLKAQIYLLNDNKMYTYFLLSRQHTMWFLLSSIKREHVVQIHKVYSKQTLVETVSIIRTR